MKVILKAYEPVLAILKKYLKTNKCARWFQYCVRTPVDDGVLVFNLLTREFIHLTEEEYSNYLELDYLKEHWFVVPEETKEKEYADLVKLVLSLHQPKSKNINHYVIFPTTDCNARCYYCFELGRSRIPMSCETAEKVVQYIKNHCGGEKVKIKWFGGEPLMNSAVIDIICKGLQREGIEFQSTMTTNGYLFDEIAVQKAWKLWNLDRVQITLDGTEKIYNKTKAYVYRDGNPYEIVLDNIGRLLDAKIAVKVRLNMDLYNAQDLLALVDDLSKRFSSRKGISVYAHHLFKGNEPMAELHTDLEWEKRGEAMRCLQDKIIECNLMSKGGIKQNFRLNHCMADNDQSVSILPDGNIGLCEHFSENEFIGHIDREGFDAAMVASWKERVPEIPECTKCFYYPDCIMLKKCSNEQVCFQIIRQEHLRKLQLQMLNSYQKWKDEAVLEEEC